MNEPTGGRQQRRQLRSLIRKHLSRSHPEIPALIRAGLAKSGGDYGWTLMVTMHGGASMLEAQERAMEVVHARYGCAGEEAWSSLHAVVLEVLEAAGFIAWTAGPRPDIQ